MRKETGLDVEIYPVSSEGSIIEALRFGHADIAFMDAGAAWMGWQQYGLEVLAADIKSDGRSYYNAHAVVLNGSEAAQAYLDDSFNRSVCCVTRKNLVSYRVAQIRWNVVANGLPHFGGICTCCWPI